MTFIINGFAASLSITSLEHHFIAQNGVVGTGADAVVFSTSTGAQSLGVAGSIFATQRGIVMDTQDWVDVYATGIVEQSDGDFGAAIQVGGADSLINVSGTVSAADFGIQGLVASTGLQVTISGTGLVSGGSNDQQASGNVASAAIQFTGDNSALTNFGTIIGDENPFSGKRIAFSNGTNSFASADGFNAATDLAARIVNGGDILGDVLFQAGRDSYEAVGDGVVAGLIHLGAGNDKLVGGDAREVSVGAAGKDDMRGRGGDDDLRGQAGADRIRGGDGDDLVNGGGGADRVFGGAGDDDVIGGSGKDILNGGRDDDVLRGGGALDTFVFVGQFGTDEIRDFSKQNGEKIDLSGVAGIRNFNDLSNNHLFQQRGNAVIDDLEGNSITLIGVGVGGLDPGDFIF